jgi:transcriptional regulator of acetoin/glycerol metabolism
VETLTQTPLSSLKTVSSAKPNPVQTVRIDDNLQASLEAMARLSVWAVPVVDDEGRLMGTLSLSDVKMDLLGGSREFVQRVDMLGRLTVRDALDGQFTSRMSYDEKYEGSSTVVDENGDVVMAGWDEGFRTMLKTMTSYKGRGGQVTCTFSDSLASLIDKLAQERVVRIYIFVSMYITTNE